jgi:hypothetical protein
MWEDHGRLSGDAYGAMSGDGIKTRLCLEDVTVQERGL